MPNEKGQLPDEPRTLMIGMYNDVDFFDIKGVCEEMFAELHITDVEYERLTDNPVYHPGRSAVIKINGKTLGVIGEVHPSVLRNFEIGAKAYIGELDFTAIFNAANRDVKYTSLTKFPAVTRDFSIVCNIETPVAEIEKVMKKAGGKLLSKLELNDVYTGSQIPEG